MIFSIFYNCVLFAVFLLYIPKTLFKKGRRSLIFERLGFRLPKCSFSKKKTFWIHANSLGEMRSCKLLLSKIRKQYPDSLIYLSASTLTGLEEAKKTEGIDLAFALPLDFSWNMLRLSKRIQPNFLILVETDFWYHHLKYAKDYGAKILLVSGKISKRSVRTYRFAPKFTKKLFSYLDLMCVQNAAYRRRFIRLGVDVKKLTITGNLKYDQETPYLNSGSLVNWKEKMGIFDDDRVITIASTHAPEEKLMIQAIKRLWDTDLSLKILLAPRHPDRFVNVANILRDEHIPFTQLSKLHMKNHTERVVLIDTMGFLPICYQLSELAIIGGSYNKKIGGHNILEPNFYSVPVFFGPFMHAQEDLRKMVMKAKSGSLLPLDQFAEFIEGFFEDQKKQEHMKQNARSLIQSLKGRVNVTFDAIKSYLEARENLSCE